MLCLLTTSSSWVDRARTIQGANGLFHEEENEPDVEGTRLPGVSRLGEPDLRGIVLAQRSASTCARRASGSSRSTAAAHPLFHCDRGGKRLSTTHESSTRSNRLVCYGAAQAS